MLSNRGLLSNKCEKLLYEEVIVSTALYGAETWGMRSAERRSVHVLEIEGLRSILGIERVGGSSGSESIQMVWIRRENG